MKWPAPPESDAGQLHGDPLSISLKEPPPALIKFIVAVREIAPPTWAALDDIKRQGLKLTDVNGMIAAAARHKARWRPVLSAFGWLPTEDGRGLVNPLMGPARLASPAPLDAECSAALHLCRLSR